MKTIDKIRITYSLTMIACGITVLIIGEPHEKALSVIPFLFALYPLSKIGFEDRY
jgi:hypothetical protein